MRESSQQYQSWTALPTFVLRVPEGRSPGREYRRIATDAGLPSYNITRDRHVLHARRRTMPDATRTIAIAWPCAWTLLLAELHKPGCLLLLAGNWLSPRRLRLVDLGIQQRFVGASTLLSTQFCGK
jgi:hypothetical protein